jgi:hypothetical protein
VEGFKKRQDEELKRREERVVDQFHLILSPANAHLNIGREVDDY